MNEKCLQRFRCRSFGTLRRLLNITKHAKCSLMYFTWKIEEYWRYKINWDLKRWSCCLRNPYTRYWLKLLTSKLWPIFHIEHTRHYMLTAHLFVISSEKMAKLASENCRFCDQAAENAEHTCSSKSTRRIYYLKD